MSRRRYSQPVVPTLGKVLTFDWDLFMQDSPRRQLKKTDLEYGNDYLIISGNFGGKIARYVGTNEVKQWGSFKTVRGNEIRVRCDTSSFACVPRLGCWMETISNATPVYDRPPMLLIQAKSLCGVASQKEVNVAIREKTNLLANFRYRDHITPESIDLPKLEQTIYKLGSHKDAHPSLRQLIRKGFFVCYEDDGWLIKCDALSRIRFMRRSNMISITICRCGRDVCNAMFDDYTLRALLPVRYFGGLVGKKPDKNKGPHMRRSSSFAGDFGFSLDELLNNYDKSQCYKRIFERDGSVVGNLLIKDTSFLDGIRSFIEHGGLSRNCICPNVSEWRRMVRMCAKGEEEFGLMEDVKIVNGQWVDVMTALPNSKMRVHSFSCVYYDGTVELGANKIGHKVLKEVHPKQDISLVFEKHLLMNGGYLVITLSRKGVNDEQLANLFDNVNEFVSHAALRYGYLIKKVGFGIYKDLMIYCDFQVWIKPKKIVKKRRIRVSARFRVQAKNNGTEIESSEEEEVETRHGKRLSNLGFDPAHFEFYNKKYENEAYYDQDGNMLTPPEMEESEKKQNKLYEYYRPGSHGNKKSEDLINNQKFQHFKGSLASPDTIDEEHSDDDTIYHNYSNSNANNFSTYANKYVYYNDDTIGNSRTSLNSMTHSSNNTISNGSNFSNNNNEEEGDDSETESESENDTGNNNGSRYYHGSPNVSRNNNNNNNYINSNGKNTYYEYYRPHSHGNQKSEDFVNNPKYNQFFSNIDEKYDSASEDNEQVNVKNNNGPNNGAQGLLARKSNEYRNNTNNNYNNSYNNYNTSNNKSSNRGKPTFERTESESRRIYMEMYSQYS